MTTHVAESTSDTVRSGYIGWDWLAPGTLMLLSADAVFAEVFSKERV